MTLRGIIFLLSILIFIPVFLGKVSIGEFVSLLKRPTSVTGEQWKNAGERIVKDTYGFYVGWTKDLYKKFKPGIEKKLEGYNIDEAFKDNNKFIEESLKVLEDTK